MILVGKLAANHLEVSKSVYKNLTRAFHYLRSIISDGVYSVKRFDKNAAPFPDFQYFYVVNIRDMPTNYFISWRIGKRILFTSEQLKYNFGGIFKPFDLVVSDKSKSKIVRFVSLFGMQESEVLSFDKACLLYTSPSPRDLSTSRMPSSA